MFNGKAKAAVWLLEQGANPSVKNMEGFTALHWLALRSMDEDSDVEEVVRSLVQNRASVENGNEEGRESKASFEVYRHEAKSRWRWR